MALGRPRVLTLAEQAALPAVLTADEYAAQPAPSYSEQWIVRYAVRGEDGYWDEQEMGFCTRDKWVELVPGDRESTVSAGELVVRRFREIMAGTEYRLRRVEYQ